jgi:hypothetical protein
MRSSRRADAAAVVADDDADVALDGRRLYGDDAGIGLDGVLDQVRTTCSTSVGFMTTRVALRVRQIRTFAAEGAADARQATRARTISPMSMGRRSLSSPLPKRRRPFAISPARWASSTMR